VLACSSFRLALVTESSTASRLERDVRTQASYNTVHSKARQVMSFCSFMSLLKAEASAVLLFQRSLAPLSPLPVSLLRKLAVATHRNNRDMRWITGMVAAAAACTTPSSAGTPFECTIHRDLCGLDEAVVDAPPAPPLAEDCCVSTVPSPPNMNNCGGSVAPLLCVHCAVTTQHDQPSSNMWIIVTLSPVVQ